MAEKTPIRTLKEAIDLDTMEKITSDDLLHNGMDFHQKIRLEARRRTDQKNLRYVCSQCGHGVYVAVTNKKEPFWKHYKDAPEKCPWWTGIPKSVAQVSANQFQGQQESPLHHKLKHVVERLLKQDSHVQMVAVEQTIIGINGRRKPDVQATYKDKKIAFEIQLATTQLPIIIGREQFYREEKRHLIWLTWQFEERPIERIQQSFLDVYYAHNKNIFSLDNETIEASQKHKTFILRAHAHNESLGWTQKLVTLNNLIWTDTGLPYAISISFSSVFREKWLKKVSSEGMHLSDKNALIDELLKELGVPIPDIDVEELARLFNCLLSLEKGEPIGTRENNLYAYANTFLSASSRHKYADLFEWAAKKFERLEVLNKETVRKKLEEAKKGVQVKGTFEAELIKLAFQDWISPETNAERQGL